MMGKVQQSGLTLIPLKVYFNSRGRVKGGASLSLVGKRQYDRRETVKKREAKREIDRAMKVARE